MRERERERARVGHVCRVRAVLVVCKEVLRFELCRALCGSKKGHAFGSRASAREVWLPVALMALHHGVLPSAQMKKIKEI